MMKKRIKLYYRIFVVLVGIVFFTYMTRKENEKLPEYYQKEKATEYIGVILSKYVDKNNHNWETIIIKNNCNEIKTIWNADKSGFFEFVTVGDSISKVSGSYVIRIYRSDNLIKSFKIDYGMK
ncbi:hypothetical protein L3073_13980 [Ancylomarina sp. DW003]|nr:hypothetical protein [Ancylomarina sp. DW003]MDE5423324.1 hypothetical protein [Ancylomarina sp. DW003]